MNTVPAAPAVFPEPAAAKVGAPAPLAVHKFGGASLASAGHFRRCVRTLVAESGSLDSTVVVVSAVQGVTDRLIRLANAARAGEDWTALLAALRADHRALASALPGAAAVRCLAWLDAEFEMLAGLLPPLRDAAADDAGLARVHGLGELWSAQLLAAFLQAGGYPARVLDAREVLVVSHGAPGVVVDWAASQARLDRWRQRHAGGPVVATGFIARLPDGSPTTLGRDGSDFSAAILARLFGADSLHIWTHVDGVLSADPQHVPGAVSLPALSYQEAAELAYFGARVLHPQTMAPAMDSGLAIRIRNSANPAHPGTRIDARGDSTSEALAKGLSLVPGLALLNVEGSAMHGLPGSSERVFAALRGANVPVVMVSQGSAEHSICCVVPGSRADAARAALAAAFATELEQGLIRRISLCQDISVLAAVGEGMAGRPGVAARFLGSLARAQVNLRAIAQGSSERNISVAVAAGDGVRALRAAHSGFWLSPHTLSIGLIGAGQVGTALVEQLSEARERLRREAGLDLRLRGVANSQRMWLGDETGDWQQELAGGQSLDLDAFAAHVQAEHLPHAVLIDCSASPALADRYAGWLAAGMHVVTPNKHAGSGPLARYRAIQAAAASGAAHFRYEATAGAGLPVIQTLRDLVTTGDVLHAIEGSLSGTLAWLFNRFDGRVPFSELVREAHALGYTEPDVREDLAGTDVARKLVILAREAGRELELEDVSVASLVPVGMDDIPAEAVLDRLAAHDDAMLARLHAARAQGKVLRHVAHLGRDGRARVGLQAVAADHPLAHLRLTDNLVQFSTRRYCANPLVVQGPGAGPEVTAAGVFADLLRVAAALGARL